MSATPLLDAATVARFTLEDFPLEGREAEILEDPRARHDLEDCLREVVSFEEACREAIELWRTRRNR